MRITIVHYKFYMLPFLTWSHKRKEPITQSNFPCSFTHITKIRLYVLYPRFRETRSEVWDTVVLRGNPKLISLPQKDGLDKEVRIPVF